MPNDQPLNFLPNVKRDWIGYYVICKTINRCNCPIQKPKFQSISLLACKDSANCLLPTCHISRLGSPPKPSITLRTARLFYIGPDGCVLNLAAKI